MKEKNFCCFGRVFLFRFSSQNLPRASQEPPQMDAKLSPSVGMDCATVRWACLARSSDHRGECFPQPSERLILWHFAPEPPKSLPRWMRSSDHRWKWNARLSDGHAWRDALTIGEIVFSRRSESGTQKSLQEAPSESADSLVG